MLTTPVSNWEQLKCYREVKSKVEKLTVTNDAAERGVKLAADKIGCAVIEQRLQNIAQVVEKDRISVPHLRQPVKKVTCVACVIAYYCIIICP